MADLVDLSCGAEQVIFDSSPAHEALRNLHVLCDVKHHPLHISWVLRTRPRLTPELREDIERSSFWYQERPLTFREVWPMAGAGSWADELALLREVDVEHFAEPLIHGALAQVESRSPGSLPVMRELISDPELCRKRFADFLASYWETCILPRVAQPRGTLAGRHRAPRPGSVAARSGPDAGGAVISRVA